MSDHVVDRLVAAPFYGSVIEAIQNEHGVWAVVAPLATRLGLDANAKVQRMKWAATAPSCSAAGLLLSIPRVLPALGTPWGFLLERPPADEFRPQMLLGRACWGEAEVRLGRRTPPRRSSLPDCNRPVRLRGG